MPFPWEQMHSPTGRCADRLIGLFGVYVLGRVEAENDTDWIAFHAESRKLISGPGREPHVSAE